MFYLELKNSDLKRLLELAAEKRMSAERIARLAFLKGLRLLMKSKSSEEVREYISEHWQQETDEVMGMALGLAQRRVAKHRTEMGLYRQEGRRLKVTPKTAPLAFFEQLDELIRKNYQTKNDCEIGELMNPVVNKHIVRNRRLKIEIKRG